MKKVLIVIVAILAIALALTACKPAGNNGGEPTETTKTTEQKPDETTKVPETTDAPTEPAKDFKAALVLTGSISDIGFSGPAYKGLMKFSEEFGAEVSYSELVQPADYDTIYRGYAEQGYNLIIGHGNQFFETATAFADEYPDIWFAVTSGPSGNGKNLCALGLSSEDVGFLVGALCGQMTKANKIASIAGSQIPPLIAVVNGTIVGAKYVNPDAEVFNVYTGNVDAAKVKEAALALIDSGCDILTQTADYGSIGGITACEERGIYNVATSADYAPQAPKTVLASVLVSNDVTIYETCKMAYEGKLEPIKYPFGIREGSVVMTGYGELEDEIPQEVKDTMAKLISDIQSGVLDTKELYDAYYAEQGK